MTANRHKDEKMPRKKVKVEITVSPDVEDEIKEQIDRTVDYAHRRVSFIVNENEPPEDTI